MSKKEVIEKCKDDLKEIHEIRKYLIDNHSLRVKYMNALRSIIGENFPKNKAGVALVSDFDCVNAESHQHAKAIIIALGY